LAPSFYITFIYLTLWTLVWVALTRKWNAVACAVSAWATLWCVELLPRSFWFLAVLASIDLAISMDKEVKGQELRAGSPWIALGVVIGLAVDWKLTPK
jgi:hypothetical protein